MRNGLALLTLGIGWVLFGTASCGKDEGTSPGTTVPGQIAHCKQCSHSSDCTTGNVCRQVVGAFAVCASASEAQCCDGPDNISGHCYTNLGSKVDGAGGTGGGIIGGGGKGGRGGSTSAGSGGTGNTTSGSNLGRACISDTDCADAALSCLTPSGLSGGDGPPKGLCTAKCTTTSDCLNVADNSYCLSFTNNDKYCVEACTEGQFGSPKCHEREEFACNLIGTIPQGTACADISDCKTGELCDPDTLECGTFVTACLPTCGGDYDCSPDQYCNFDSGFCTSAKPTGLPLGSHCTPATGNTTDPCNGFCQSGTNPKEGECGGFCSLNAEGTGCGWDGSGAADNACLFGSVLSAGQPVSGDVGFCGKLCDCNADCTLTGEYCVDESMGNQIKAIFGRNGYCRALDAASGETVSDSFRQCPGGGTGGTGGTNGSSGEGGDPGSSGGKGGSSATNGGEAGQSGAGAGGQGGG